ncbi:hypothetical protein GCK32_017333 [Trichostrongylus colubriformis]|uniref:Uncharacterized protein n=1 Tax=Trichostrongylus colubriformis TaxID=6319 RepID=A0AAN8FDJ5_TRICO
MADGVHVAAVVRLMDSLMVPPDKNCSERMDTPSAREFLAHLEPFQVVLLAIAGAFTFVVYSLALIHWFYVYSFVSIETRRNKLYWLVTLFPVSTGCCLIGMLAPRTSLIMTALGLLYYLMCLFVIVSLCRVRCMAFEIFTVKHAKLEQAARLLHRIEAENIDQEQNNDMNNSYATKQMNKLSPLSSTNIWSQLR